jgi:DNA-binding NtrC family response regulator
MNTASILIVDDEEKLRSLLTRIIRLEGFITEEAADLKTARKKLETFQPDIILCDVKLPDGTGIEFVEEIRRTLPFAEVILLTAYGNIPDGVQAIKNGAFDYITKGDDNNKIIPLLYRAAEKRALSKRVQQLEKQLGIHQSFEKILGNSPSIKQAVLLARKVAPSDVTILLTGETGTGKEVFAQAIHGESIRKNKNFIAVNCAAISKELLESELFGYKAGAFTGANKDHKGLFEEAHGGTLFLDEIGEMPWALQAKLLRILENGEYIRVGDTKTRKADVRIIAATHRDLQEDIKAHLFREDLFYRIAAINIQLPSLRERVEDIEIMTNHFIQLFAAKINRTAPTLTKDFLFALQKHEWRGNIRELKNVIERSVLLNESGILEASSLPFYTTTNEPTTLSAFDLASAEKLHIQKVLNYTKGNKTEAAKLLNIALTTLYRSWRNSKSDNPFILLVDTFILLG